MAFVPIPNSVKSSLDFTWGGQNVAITMGWTKETSVQGSDLTTLATALEGWADDYLMEHLNSGLVLVNINCTDVSSESGTSYDLQLTTPRAGTESGVAVPNNVAAVVTQRTLLRGRSYRGRVYIPGLSNSSLLNTIQLTSAAMAALLADFYALFDVETAVGLWRSVHSRWHDKAARTTGVATRIWTYSVDSYLDSQRRRLGGRGI